MKKMTSLLSIVALGLYFQSCVTTRTQLTDNPIGTKKGVASAGIFTANPDVSITTAAKNGKITKIGSVEYKTTYYLIFPVVKTIVTGE